MITAYPGVSFEGSKETGSYLYPTPCFRGSESFCPVRIFFAAYSCRAVRLLSVFSRACCTERRGPESRKPRKCNKNAPRRGEGVDRLGKMHIMKATEQSMIEARNRISSTPLRRRDRRVRKAFPPKGIRPPAADMPGPSENIRRTVALLPKSGALSDNRLPRKTLCHEQYLLCS